MKLFLLAITLALAPNVLAYQSHTDIVNQMQKGKVGKAPQMGKSGGPKPKYNHFKQVFPRKNVSKHHRKGDYSK